MKSLEERKAARAQRALDNSAPEGASRDDLQAAAEQAVERKDEAAGIKSAPFAERATPRKTPAKKTAGKAATPTSPFAEK